MTSMEIQSTLNTTHTPTTQHGIKTQLPNKHICTQMTGMTHTPTEADNKANEEDVDKDNTTLMTHTPPRNTDITKTIMLLPTTEELKTTGAGENKKLSDRVNQSTEMK